jgi:negative regulator of sigma E activity
MSPANLRELLTAAIDGELTPAERKTARRLLRQSEAARTLYAQLKADAARLKKLPRVAAPADIADNVMAAINERSVRPTPLPPARGRARRFNWAWLPIGANIAAAAGVLVAVTLGSYFYFTASERYLALQKEERVAKLPPVKNLNEGSARPPVEPRDHRVDLQPEQLTEKPRVVPDIGPLPREVPRDSYTGPIPDPVPEIEPFNPEKIRLSHLVRMNELATDADVRKKLATEMKKDELIRLDLFCQSPAKAYELVAVALKARGITTVTDGAAQDRLKKNQPTNLMVFTEALTPDEVAQLLTALGAEDKKSGAGQFDTLVAAPFLGDDLLTLGKLLGMPNLTSKLPKSRTGVDIRKPLPEGTAQHVANSLSGMGGTSARPPKPESMAVVVSYWPATGNPSASREIKQFVERRGERKAEAKPLMLVLKSIPK